MTATRLQFFYLFYPRTAESWRLRRGWLILKMADAYFSGWAEVLLFIVGALLFVALALFASSLLRPKRPNADKLATYESGEDPKGLAWTQFNIRFYIIALVFLLFEVEIIFLFPWTAVFMDETALRQTNNQWGWFNWVEMMGFVAVLALGLGYAWSRGFLEWVKPRQKVSDFQSPVPKKLYENINERYR